MEKSSISARKRHESFKEDKLYKIARKKELLNEFSKNKQEMIQALMNFEGIISSQLPDKNRP